VGFLMRCAAVVFCSWALSGCITEPPTYEDSQRIPPFIVADKVEPPLSVINRLPAGTTDTTVQVWFFSEDLGDSVRALAYVDLRPGESRVTADDVRDIPPSSFDEMRSVELDVSTLSAGCHTVTVVLTHRSNLTAKNEVSNKDLAARAVWWFEVPLTDSDTLLKTCPQLGEEER
jgi:hypothetical protein